MSTLPPLDEEYMLNFLINLLNTPSPTGFTGAAIALTETAFRALGLETRRTRKGSLLVTLPGEKEDTPRGLTAHVDTLGAMVKEIKENGRLKMSPLGGFPWHFVEGEGCWVYTQSGQRIRGSILSTAASVHVYGSKARETSRDSDHMEIRLDARTSSAEETRALGIAIGDYVVFDPRVETTEGFIRSRHLDDKAGVAAILAAAKALADANLKPAQKTYVLISNYEEVGHGAAAGWPDPLHELVAVDMAAVGAGQASDEFHATLCLKDSGGPYHHGLSGHLRRLAERYNIPFKTDIYPYYGSDGEALWRAGADVAIALIGPGVDASHNYERTHREALEATARWILAYLLN